MKKYVRILAGALTLALMLGTAAAAAGDLSTISVTRDVKVLVNGAVFTPRDANGKEVSVFAHEGTTYVPLRAVAEAFGLEVSYDAGQQAAVINGSTDSGSQVKPPVSDDVHYIVSCGPEQMEGETFYSEIEDDMRYLLEDPSQKAVMEILSGSLPDGVEQDGTVLRGTFLSTGIWDLRLRLTPSRGEPVERDVRIEIKEPQELQAGPVVIWGRVGDDIGQRYIPCAQSQLYTGDDLVEEFESLSGDTLKGASPIGTKAGLDQLAQYGLSLDYETYVDEEGDWAWVENFVTGTLTKGTDGWIKISVPVYAGAGVSPSRIDGEVLDKDGNLLPLNWWVVEDESGELQVVHGQLEIYLNVIDF